MKKFLLFTGNFHYPEGGWLDFRSDFNTLEEANTEYEENYKDKEYGNWYHIVDIISKQIVS